MKPILRRPRLYWAGKRFVRPGLYTWAFGNNRRLLPAPHLLIGWQYRPRSWRLHELRHGKGVGWPK
jgi:hypothetical protein